MSTLERFKQLLQNLFSGGTAPAPRSSASTPPDTKAAAAPQASAATPPPASGPPADPYKEASDKTIATLTWFVGALAAIATLVVAGTQLSSIGELSKGPRLGWAIGSAAAALAGTIAAIGLLTWARLPGKPADQARLQELAQGKEGRRGNARRDAWLLDRVEADPAFHRGTGSLKDLMAQMSATDVKYHEALKQFHKEKSAARATTTDPKAENRKAAKAKAALDVATDDVKRLRFGVQMSAHLLRYIDFRRKVYRAIWAVLALSVVVAAALVTLAWAANPPEEDSTPQAVARPVHAQLYLVSKDEIWSARLGAECASAARTADGIEVVALASDDESATVVTIPSGQCLEPRRVVVPSDDGAVIAVSDSLPDASG